MSDQVLIFTYFAFLLGIGVFVANLLKKARLPDIFFLLIVGFVLGPTIWSNPNVLAHINVAPIDVSVMGAVPDFLRTLALILVVFTGSFNLNIQVFKRFSGISINLALSGVIFNTSIFGFVAKIIFNLELVPAFLLGSVISGTSSEIVFALKDTLKKREKVLTILEVESIFNTPLCLLLPIIFLDLFSLAPGAVIEPYKYLTLFWQLVAAGIGTGLLLGIVMSKLVGKIIKGYSPLFIFSLALVTYAVAENVGGSGMLAVAICGLVIGNLVFPFKEEVARFEDALSEMFRISVFTLLGAQVLLLLEPKLLLFEISFAMIVLASRPLFVMPLLGKLRSSLDKRSQVIISGVAPRGIAAAAMAPLVSSVIGNDLIINIVFMVILLSVVFSTAITAIAGRKEPEKEESIEAEAAGAREAAAEELKEEVVKEIELPADEDFKDF
jgi:cell volume regulation protein A